MPRRPLILLLVLTLAGCGTSGDGRPDADATLMLDTPPAAAEAGIAIAVDRAYTDAEGVDIDLRLAREGESGLDDLERSAAEFTVTDLPEVAGHDRLIAVMALTQARGSTPARVLVTTKDLVEEQPEVVAATVHAFQRGYRETIADPESAVTSVLDAARRLGADAGAASRTDLKRSLDGLSPSFQASDGTIGTLSGPNTDPQFARSGVKLTQQEDG